jgi:glucose-1-phosphate adenylyltransferase
MKEENIVVLAGGVSSRMKQPSPALLDPALRRDAETKSKAMIGVGQGGRPFLDFLLLNIARAGYDDLVIVVNEKDSAIREYYAPGPDIPGRPADIRLRISFAVQRIPQGRTKPLGTADALLVALRSKPAWKGGQVTVCNADNLYSVRALRILRESTVDNALIDYDRSALAFDEERIAKFAVIEKNGEGRLTNIIEKPPRAEIEGLRDRGGRIGVSMNIFRFSVDDILPVLEKLQLHPVRDEKELPEAVRMMITTTSATVEAIPIAEHVPDLTSQEDILRVQETLRES